MAEQRIGKVIQIIGPAVDVEFEEGNLPAIYNAVRIVDNGELGKVPIDVVVEVVVIVVVVVVAVVVVAVLDVVLVEVPQFRTAVSVVSLVIDRLLWLLVLPVSSQLEKAHEP